MRPDTRPDIGAPDRCVAASVNAPPSPRHGGGMVWGAATLSLAPAAIVIGPEGGLSPDEDQRLRPNPNVTPLSLGPRILRADTTAVAALTLRQAASGDWR